MFSKQSSAILKQQFWTSFGQYMAPVPPADGTKTNWINYKTGVKDIHFKFEAGSHEATIAIVLLHADTSRQTYVFNQFVQLKHILEQSLQEEWQWQLKLPGENNKTISRISKTLSPVNIYRKEDWPLIISFFKPRIIALDLFWNAVKYSFEE